MSGIYCENGSDTPLRACEIVRIVVLSQVFLFFIPVTRSLFYGLPYWRSFILLSLFLTFLGWGVSGAPAIPPLSGKKVVLPSLEKQLGQKLMLDLRYFCVDDVLLTNGKCRTPVTSLSSPLSELIVKANIGGVILFAENIQSIDQLVTFNYQLQMLAKRNGLPPLFIAIDQEGGRVARLPDDMATRFVGNMAIGATPQVLREKFAFDVAKGMAQSLKLLGVNVNFSPNIDVNMNPANPVINVRSFGESPNMVARLGVQSVSGTQSQGVISAVKHFPGHGDTHVDSHTGLPRVDRSLLQIHQQDLLPFKHAIQADTPPHMLMTAHIQYPALDNTTFKGKDGIRRMVPATMSKKILTTLLRQQLGYKGVVVTDALDMAGVAAYFSPSQAVIQTFDAGADIALMPIALRQSSDIDAFWAMYQAVLDKVSTRSGALWLASYERIQNLKRELNLGAFTQQSLSQRIDAAVSQLPLVHNKKLEQKLADHAITLVKGAGQLPIQDKGQWLALMPDKLRCQGLTSAINRWFKNANLTCISLVSEDNWPDLANTAPPDVVLAADISPVHSVIEMGGMEDFSKMPRANLTKQYEYLHQLFEQVAPHSTRVFVALRAPYSLSQFTREADIAIATYGYNVDNTQVDIWLSPVMESLAKVLSGNIMAQGNLPVSVEQKAVN